MKKATRIFSLLLSIVLIIGILPMTAAAGKNKKQIERYTVLVLDTSSSATFAADRFLPTPNRPDYTFEGWYISTDDKNPVTSSTVFTDDTTLYAKWKDENAQPPFNPTLILILTVAILSLAAIAGSIVVVLKIRS